MKSQEVYCRCGRYLRDAFPPFEGRCFHCGTTVIIDADGNQTHKNAPKGSISCSKCKALLIENPSKGASYQCPNCNLWSAHKDDKVAQKRLEKLNAKAIKIKTVDVRESKATV